MPHQWTCADDAMLVALPMAEVQRLMGRTMSSIIARRVRLKRMGYRINDQRTSEVWMPEADDLVRKLHSGEVAARLGVSVSAAFRRRAAIGLPPVGRYCLPPRTTPKRIKRKWTPAELNIVLSLPLDKALPKLPHRTQSAILAIRCYMRRKGNEIVDAKWGRPKKQGRLCERSFRPGRVKTRQLPFAAVAYVLAALQKLV